jgi:hypothetical protein
MQQRKRRRGMLGTLLLAAILATAIFAYTSSISLGDTSGNVGYGAVHVADGYTVSNIDYVPSSDFQKVTEVDFNISPLPSGATADLRVSLDGGTNWSTCTLATPAVCTLSPQPNVVDVTDLDVYAEG